MVYVYHHPNLATPEVIVGVKAELSGNGAYLWVTHVRPMSLDDVDTDLVGYPTEYLTRVG